MVVEEKKSARILIKNLFVVLFLGVICAIVIAMGSLYLLGPTGSYRAKNILLSSRTLNELAYSNINPQTGETISYRFDHVEFLYFDLKKDSWQSTQVSKEAYAEFYQLISADQSIGTVPEQVEDLFTDANPAILSLVVKKQDDGTNAEMRSFQEVQILNYDDYYRIQIHDRDEVKNWAYFFHENIFEEAMKILL